MKRTLALLAAPVVLVTALLSAERLALAQPAKGAAAAFERVREVMTNRFRDVALVGDPDRDFATLLIAHHEDLVFLAKTQLEYGSDRQLRELAQKIADEQQAQIAAVKEWQVRRQHQDYRARPDQPPHGSGPLDRAGARTAQVEPAPAPAATQAAPAAANLPAVPGTVEKVDAAQGKLTLDHGPIPNLNMDAMTMVFRVQDPALLRGLKEGDRIRFQADRVNGQLSVVKIDKGR